MHCMSSMILDSFHARSEMDKVLSGVLQHTFENPPPDVNAQKLATTLVPHVMFYSYFNHLVMSGKCCALFQFALHFFLSTIFSFSVFILNPTKFFSLTS